MPRLLARAKPALTPISSTVTSPDSARSASTVPSVEPLSTTIDLDRVVEHAGDDAVDAGQHVVAAVVAHDDHRQVGASGPAGAAAGRRPPSGVGHQNAPLPVTTTMTVRTRIRMSSRKVWLAT